MPDLNFNSKFESPSDAQIVRFFDRNSHDVISYMLNMAYLERTSKLSELDFAIASHINKIFITDEESTPVFDVIVDLAIARFSPPAIQSTTSFIIDAPQPLLSRIKNFLWASAEV